LIFYHVKIGEEYRLGCYFFFEGKLLDMDVFEKVGTRVSSRLHSGITRLDELISGGFPDNSTILVSGTPGSGKTIMCYHYIQEGLKNDERCLYLTSDERVENILKQAGELGFNFSQYVDSGQLDFFYLNLESGDVYKQMEKKVKENNYNRVVLDSITPVSEMPFWVSDGAVEIVPSDGFNTTKKIPLDSISVTRLHVRRIINILRKENCTCLVTSEIPEGSRGLSRDTISEFMVDGIILMDLDTSMDRRKLTIRKMRATKHTLKPQDIIIDSGGIKFL